MPAGPRRPDAPGLLDTLHDPPRLGLGQGKTRGTMGQTQRLANLPFGQRLLARHQVGLDAGDRGRDAPGRAHLPPGRGELESDGLGRRAGYPFEDELADPRCRA